MRASEPLSGRSALPVAARRAREAEAYDEGQVWEVSHRWNMRVPHVLTGPNTMRGEQLFRRLLGERADNARALDVGCGKGGLSRELHDLGARSVYGFDVSSREVEVARSHSRDLRGVTFGVHGLDGCPDDRFDLIAGRSVLHHLDFREALPVLFERNLRPGGRMVFMEPMSHPMTLAFHRVVRSAHTPDEWPLTPSDVAWLRRRFQAQVSPINLISFPVAALSSFACSSPENRMLRFADRIDSRLERLRPFSARGRQGIIRIDRPAR